MFNRSKNSQEALTKKKARQLADRVKSLGRFYVGSGFFLEEKGFSMNELNTFEGFLDRLEYFYSDPNISDRFLEEYIDQEIEKLVDQKWIIMASIGEFADGAMKHVYLPERIELFSELGRQTIPKRLVNSISVKPIESPSLPTSANLTFYQRWLGLYKLGASYTTNAEVNKMLQITEDEDKIFENHFIEENIKIPWHLDPSLIQSAVGVPYAKITLHTINDGLIKELYCIQELVDFIVDKLNYEFGLYNVRERRKKS